MLRLQFITWKSNLFDNSIHLLFVHSLLLTSVYLQVRLTKLSDLSRKINAEYQLQNEANIFNDYILSLLQVRRNFDGFIVDRKDNHISILDTDGDLVLATVFQNLNL